MFNNDIRLRALKTIAEALAPIEQKKSILYFSAGMQRSGQDNQVELRAAINAAVRANVVFYPIDTRGLQAVVPGGDARQASGRGNSMFSGRGVAQQYDTLAQSQDTLTSLAADTGGRAFTDTNDFGEAFARVQSDMSAYYLLAYSSSNPARDGQFRRIQVKTKRDGLKVEARSGYYAERDFGHTNRGDRETELQDQLFSAVSATDLPVMVNAGFFRLSADRYYVPVALVVPGYAVPVANATDKISLDVLGLVRDEQGRPLGRFRETLQLPPGSGKTLAGTQVLYQSGVTLPPGRFSVKAVVRENATGLMGTYEAPIIIPELKKEGMKVSSVGAEHADRAGGEGQDRQPARPRRPSAGAEPHPRGGTGSEADVLLRGLRSLRDRRPHRRSGRASRSTGARSRSTKRPSSSERPSTHPTGTRRCSSSRFPQDRVRAGTLHLPGQHHRHHRRTLCVPPPGDVCEIAISSQLSAISRQMAES